MTIATSKLLLSIALLDLVAFTAIQLGLRYASFDSVLWVQLIASIIPFVCGLAALVITNGRTFAPFYSGLFYCATQFLLISALNKEDQMNCHWFSLFSTWNVIVPVAQWVFMFSAFEQYKATENDETVLSKSSMISSPLLNEPNFKKFHTLAFDMTVSVAIDSAITQITKFDEPSSSQAVIRGISAACTLLVLLDVMQNLRCHNTAIRQRFLSAPMSSLLILLFAASILFSLTAILIQFLRAMNVSIIPETFDATHSFALDCISFASSIFFMSVWLLTLDNMDKLMFEDSTINGDQDEKTILVQRAPNSTSFFIDKKVLSAV